MARWLRWLIYLGGGFFALLMVLALFAVWLVTTTPGAQFAAYLAQSQEPRLKLQVTSGNLLEGVEARNVVWQQDKLVAVELDELDLRWDAMALLSRKVEVELLELRGVDIRVAEGDLAEESPVEVIDDDTGPIVLPHIELPVDLNIGSVVVDRVRLQLGEDDPHWIRRAELSLRASGSAWHVKRLMVERDDARVEIHGEVNTADAYPVSMFVNASAAIPGLPERVRLSSRLGGSVTALTTSHRLAGPVTGDLELDIRPLDPDMPFNLQGSGLSGGWPPDGNHLLAARDVDLLVRGDLDDIEGQLSAHLAGENVPAGDWDAEFSADLQRQRAEVKRLEGGLLAGSLLASGELNWGEQLLWQADIALVDLDPSQQWDGAPSDVNGPIRVAGEAGESGWGLDVRLDGLSAWVEGNKAYLEGQLGHRRSGVWYLENLHAEVEGGDLVASGELGEELSLDLDAQFTDLGALHEDLEGAIQASAKVQGPLQRPYIETRGNGRGISWAGEYCVERLSWDVVVPSLGLEPGTAEVVVDAIQVGDYAIDRVEAEGFGSRAAHQLTLHANAPDGQGNLALAGGWLEGRGWRGMVVDANGQVMGHSLSLERSLTIRQDGDRFEVSPHCWAYKDARLCVEETIVADPQSADADVSLSNFNFAWLDPVLPAELDWQGRLSAASQISWHAEDGVKASLVANGSQGRVSLLVEEAIDDLPRVVRDLDYRHISVAASYSPEQADVRFDFAAEEAGQMHADLSMEPNLDGDGWLDGSVSLSGLQAGFFHPFVPQLSELSGRFDADLQLDGSLSAPEFNGLLEFSDGEILTRESPTKVDRLNLKVELNGSKAGIAGGFYIGSERAQISGQADWEQFDNWLVEVGVEGQRLEAIYPPYARLRVSPDLMARVRPGTVEVVGSVHVPSGKITVQEIPQQVVAKSDDAVVIRRERDDATDILEEVAQAWGFDADLELSMGDRVDLEAFGINGKLTGSMRIRQRPEAEPAGFGELRIVDGEYRAYGQRLSIRRGMVMFSGPLDRPELDVEAVRRIERDGVTAGLRLIGSAREPNVSVFSEPAMSEEDALSYMIRGRPLGAEGPGSDALVAQAAVALGVYGAQSAVGGFAEQLGVEDFEIDAVGEGEEAQVVVSGYVRPNLYVAYGVGVFQPLNTVTLRYYLTQQLFMEAVSSEESALDLMYRFDID
ncbi:translocation/assembly module TamB domain-containing protein [Halorhodospira halochloris]|uniref:autotransporter assembly complex protein TamB n=1 Tax=Halorhodospira halochloris TaxID=1052 RepID=UPI001EE854C8|nr:translocation/assembly module TamB domain-containing protein [Halorhodospira halochloris]MCG5547793.1 translocation/assembly module TamB domain-containing protein [Halorhodospira halochloris]